MISFFTRSALFRWSSSVWAIVAPTAIELTDAKILQVIKGYPQHSVEGISLGYSYQTGNSYF